MNVQYGLIFSVRKVQTAFTCVLLILFILIHRHHLEQITSDVRNLKRGHDRYNAEIATYHLQRYVACLNIRAYMQFYSHMGVAPGEPGDTAPHPTSEGGGLPPLFEPSKNQ